MSKCSHLHTTKETAYNGGYGREVAYLVCEDCGETLRNLGLTGERV